MNKTAQEVLQRMTETPAKQKQKLFQQELIIGAAVAAGIVMWQVLNKKKEVKLAEKEEQSTVEPVQGTSSARFAATPSMTWVITP